MIRFFVKGESYGGLLGKAKIILDGKKTDALKNYQTKTIKINQGTHIIQAGYGLRAKSNKLEFSVEKDEEIQIMFLNEWGEWGPQKGGVLRCAFWLQMCAIFFVVIIKTGLGFGVSIGLMAMAFLVAKTKESFILKKI